MNDYLSKKLRYIGLICMIFVVFIHAYNYQDSFLQPNTIISEGLNLGACLEFMISNALTRSAVPIFFAISGFLFF